jgi:hypothetical protein
VEIVVRWVIFECNSMGLILCNCRIKKGFPGLPFTALRDIKPQGAMRIRVPERSHNGIPCPASRIAADNNWALDDLASRIVQFPEGFVFTRAQTVLGLVGIVTNGDAVRGVVPVRDVSLREWGTNEDGILD